MVCLDAVNLSSSDSEVRTERPGNEGHVMRTEETSEWTFWILRITRYHRFALTLSLLPQHKKSGCDHKWSYES